MDQLGIDLAKARFDATLLLNSGKQHHRSFPNSPAGFEALAAWLAEHHITQLHACMEATNIYYEALASFLYQAGYTVSVVNPARIKGFAQAEMQRNKTDKLDSALIAAFCAKHTPEPWKPMSEAQRRLRALVRHRDDLLQTQLQQRNRLRDTTDALVVGSLEAVLEIISKQLKEVEQQIKAHVAAHAELQAQLTLLQAIVGIGLVTAVKVMAEFVDLGQYESAKAAAADAGLTPAQFESGTSVRRKTRVSKVGKASVRAALYLPAMTAMRRCKGCKAFAEQLAARGKPKKVIIVAVMRKLVHICYGVLKHRTPYDPAKAFRSAAKST